MDNHVLNLIVARLRPLLEGGRIRRAYASRDGIVLQTDSAEVFFCLINDLPLVLSGGRHPVSDGQYAALASHLTADLTSCSIEGFEKEGADKIVQIQLRRSDQGFLLLYVAIPGRVDLILTDESGLIMQAAHALRNQVYKRPAQRTGDIDLYTAGDEKLLQSLQEIGRQPEPERELARRFTGVDKFLASELAARLRRDPAKAADLLLRLKSMDFGVALVRSSAGEDRSLTLLPDLYESGGHEVAGSFEEPFGAAETLLRKRLRAVAIAQLLSEIKGAVSRQLSKARRLRRNLEADERGARKGAELGKLGDLILANKGAIRRGAESVEVEDVFAERGGIVRIELDPAKDAVANAQTYYKRARKARKTLDSLQARFSALEADRRPLQTYQERIAADGDNLKALRALQRELAEKGWLKQHRQRKLQIRREPGRRFLSSDGLEIIIGRNNRDNEEVSFKVGRDNDFWFHAAGYSGSHVLARNPRRLAEPPPATLAEAAALAAYYSKARQGSNVTVHWTQRRFIRKAKGGSAGSVLLKGYKSVVADPQIPETVRKL